MVVRMRHTHSQTRQRRSHHALKATNLSACKECGAPVRSHMACMACGNYNGKKIAVKGLATAKLEKKAKKGKKKA